MSPTKDSPQTFSSTHLEDATDIKHAADNNRVDPEVAKYASAAAIEIDSETNKRLKRMIDKRVLLVMMVTYFLQALDKGTISFASIMGIVDDTRLVGQQYSWLTTIVYIAVLVVEYPTNWIIQRISVAKYLAANIICWGAVLALHAACKNFGGLLAVRFFLGALEACCQPCFVFLSGMWYRRSEQSTTVVLWYAMNGLQQIVGGLLAYCFSNIPDKSPIHSWQALFITYGCITVLWGVFVLWWMPDSPMKSKCFSEDDKKLMVERVRSNQSGLQNRKFRVEQIYEALRDPQTYAFGMIQICTTLPNSGLNAFSALLVKSFGFDVLQTQLLSMVLGAVMIIIMFGAVWVDRKTGQPIYAMAASVIPSIAGTVILMTVERTSKANEIGLLLAYYVTISFWACSALCLSLITRNVAGQTKRSFVIATNFLCWAVGNCIGPQVFRSNDAPRYFIAFSVHVACYGVLAATLLLLRAYYAYSNKVRDKRTEDGEITVDSTLAHGFEDKTDKENLNFRYHY
ncbi:MFS domain-containing protein [Fusarium sp. LHS14.1]|nr:MFS domain-containing protein [Fusarium sp. LHS14.1]